MTFDFRFRNVDGHWESAGYFKGSDRSQALSGLARRQGGTLPAGKYMSRPRGRQRDWDLFELDDAGTVLQDGEPAPRRAIALGPL